MSSLEFLSEIRTMRFNDIKSAVRGFISLHDVAEYKDEYNKIYETLNKDERKNVRALGETVNKKLEHYEAEVIRVKKLYEFDKSFTEGYVAGVDEVGRGPLAGPIVAAAVVLDENSEDLILRINDSKKLSREVREELYDIIREKAVSYCISLKTNEEIDDLGIGFCNNEIFKEAVSGLNVKPSVVLSDGYTIKGFEGFEAENKAVIKGDTKSAAIACASIIAKVYRDRIMEEYSKEYTHYGFEKNVGYGTKEHIDAILKYGSCKIHRDSFLRNIL